MNRNAHVKQTPRITAAALAAVLLTSLFIGVPVDAAGRTSQSYIDASNSALIRDHSGLYWYGQAIESIYNQNPIAARTDSTVFLNADGTPTDDSYEVTLTTYFYNDNGCVTQVIHQGTAEDDYFAVETDEYDRGGQVYKTTMNVSGSQESEDGTYEDVIVCENTYQNGLLVTSTNDYGDVTRYAYDRLGRITDITYTQADGSADRYHYTYKNNRIIRMTSNYQAGFSTTTKISYDDNKRLESASVSYSDDYTNSVVDVYYYDYDENGALQQIRNISANYDVDDTYMVNIATFYY